MSQNGPAPHPRLPVPLRARQLGIVLFLGRGDREAEILLREVGRRAVRARTGLLQWRDRTRRAACLPPSKIGQAPACQPELDPALPPQSCPAAVGRRRRAWLQGEGGAV